MHTRLRGGTGKAGQHLTLLQVVVAMQGADQKKQRAEPPAVSSMSHELCSTIVDLSTGMSIGSWAEHLKEGLRCLGLSDVCRKEAQDRAG